jgi:hypothetical protein
VEIDREAAIEFLRIAYEPEDWIAVFLKSYVSGRVAQRILPVSLALDARVQEWLLRENASKADVYVSVNAVRANQTSRRRSAISAIRHLFLDADREAAGVLAAIGARADLPPLSYVIESSRGRAHILWRVSDLDKEASESLQKMLARQLQTDAAATSCAQLTRLPGFVNHKYAGAQRVTVEYGEAHVVYRRSDFPPVRRPTRAKHRVSDCEPTASYQRARLYAASVPPAIAGQHGDLVTFRLCCRLVRGFALTDIQAFSILGEWNARCDPPWTYRELRAKLDNARRYGREPVGGLLGTAMTPSP